ncbi:MAG: glycosyltransferase family 1 protein, partial [Patescibacteria group bacterium]
MQNHHHKILLDCRFWGSGHTGLGRYTTSLVTELYRQKPKFDLALLINPESKTEIEAKLNHPQLLLSSSRPYSLTEQLSISKIIRAFQPDLVHFLHFNVPLLNRTPFIVTIHDLIKHHSRGLDTTTKSPLFYPIKRLGYQLTMAKVVRQSRLILTPSQWVKQDILNHYSVNQNKIIVTPEAADKSYFKSSLPLAVPSYDYLIYVGNAYPHKNLIQLIKAVQVFRQNYSNNAKNLKLIIVTARNVFYDRLREHIRKTNAQSSVKLTHFTSDQRLAGLYRHSLAFITASLSEGFGLPGLEAMAAKTLVLASNRTALPEVYGPAAIYFNPDNLSDIVAKINQVVNLEPKTRNKLIQSGIKRVYQFSWAKTAQLTLKAYENCF